MKKIVAICLILSFGQLCCACEVSMPRIGNFLPEAPTQMTGIATNPVQEDPAEETTIPTTVPETVTPTETVPAETTPPATEAPQMAPWKTAYLNYLKKVQDEYCAFALVYIDADNIPEIYLNGTCEAQGDMVCAYKNGKVVEEQLSRTYGGSYIPKSGLLINQNGHMGYYYTDIYRLAASGFKHVWSGEEIEEEVWYEETDEWDYELHYYIDGIEVSEEEYYAAIEAIFALDKAVELYENAVSYKTIRQQITDHS